MGWMRFFRRSFWHVERERELDAYLDQEAEDNIARGMTRAEARAAAQRRLGNVTFIREEIYRMNTVGFLETLWQDLRYGLRMLRQTPGLTAVALLSLSLGIGAATSIFSVVYGVLISPYPYARSGEIWAPGLQDAQNPKQGRGGFTIPEYRRMRELKVWSATMATLPDSRVLGGGRPPESFTMIQVTADAFQFLGVEPVLGRTILPSDVAAGGQPDPVIVLTDKAWRRLFDGRADALGKKLVLSDVTYTVIGVMPSRFGWWTDDGGWVPMALDPRDEARVAPIVRLAAGVSPRAGEEQLQALFTEIAKASPNDFPKGGFRAQLKNYLDITVASGTMETSLRLLFGAVGFLLLIACANVANLQLARATSRAREIALRMAVGAGRARVLRQLLTENLVLSVAGALLGIALAKGITVGVEALMPDFYKPNEARIAINGYVLDFTAAVAVLTGILFGLAPALQCSRLDLVETLKEATKGSGAAGGSRTRSVLVVAEVALSVILLVGAALTVRGFVQLQQTALGFQTERILMVGVPTPPKRYTTWEQRVAFAQNLAERASAIPGAQSVAIGNGGMPFGGMRSAYTIDGRPGRDSQPLMIGLISADFGRTLGIPLLRGRALSAPDIAHADRVAVINEAAAKLWPAGVDPTGRRIHLNVLDRPRGMLLAPGVTSGDVTIIGVMANTRNDGLTNPPAPQLFLPYTIAAPAGRALVLRAYGDPMRLLSAVREQVRQIDPEVPVNRPITMEEVIGTQVKQPRFNMALFTFFGGLGLALAAIGIFGVLSYSVARRTHEIGVRMALGAERKHVLGLMMAMGGKLVLMGLGVGLVASFVLGRYLQSQVFSVPVTDPLSIAGAVLLLVLAALIACIAPARRAARLEPMSALRHD
ncbi:MAG TPA: ABC transporter permease [Candidatus Solibacter sp.]|nr:ABC transporter permease [Candidatus Solibacter sp.]